MDNELIKRMFEGDNELRPAPESRAKADAWLVKNNRRIYNYIGGKWEPPAEDRYFETLNPGTGEVLAKVAWSSKKDVDQAFLAAYHKGGLWRSMNPHKRAEVLYAIARNTRKYARELAVIESLDTGKVIGESRDIDVPLVEKWFNASVDWAEVVRLDYPDHKPYGIIAQIIPWNFPLLMFAWKVSVALACGNAVVIKPADLTPLSVARFVDILEESGLPAGAVNIVFGKGDTGALVASHEFAKKVAFTGSTRVGKELVRNLAGTGKRLTMELGGKGRNIITANADLDSAVDSKVEGSFLNQGHVCCACSVDLVHESVYDEYVRKLKWRIGTLIGAGPPHYQLDKNPDIGAVNSADQLLKIGKLVVEAQVVDQLDVWQPEGYTCPTGGFYHAPTVVTGATISHRIAQEEIFGPVVVVIPFRTIDDAVDLANNTRYGLAASIWTQDINEALELATRVRVGTVWVNSTNVFDPAAGFGGVRESGYGREGGREGMLEYLHEDFAEPAAEPTIPEPIYPKYKRGLDKTYRLWNGGRLARPDGDTSFPVYGRFGERLATASDANYKDVRNAVEAARGAVPSWAALDADLRTKIMRFIAENLSDFHTQARFVEAIIRSTGRTESSAEREVNAAIERLFYFAARARMYEGTVQKVSGKFNVEAIQEPVGVVGVRCPDEYPLLGVVNSLAPLYAFGNAVVLVVGSNPIPALEFIKELESSDIPPGTINVLSSSDPDGRALDLANHEDVDAVWYFGGAETSREIEIASAHNLKRVFTTGGRKVDWIGHEGRSERFLRESFQVKNIWVPFGT